MKNLEEEGVKIISYDESNHGLFPEYFVGVFSNNLYDLIRHKKLLNKKNPKSKKTSEKVFNLLEGRKFNFLQAEENDYERISTLRFPGIVMASLAEGIFENEGIKKLYLLYDGDLKTSQKLFTLELFHSLFGLERKAIILSSGKDFDRLYYGVNLADKLAYHLFRYGGSAEKKSNMLERRVLLE